MATAGLPDPVLGPAPAPDFVAIAVGKTQDGASFPANPVLCQIECMLGCPGATPSFEKPVPLENRSALCDSGSMSVNSLVHDNGWGLGRHLGRVVGRRW